MRQQTDDDEDEPDLGEKCHFLEDELAQRWRISPRTLQRRRRAGLGPGYLKFGKCVLYPLEEVEQYEARHLRNGPPQ